MAACGLSLHREQEPSRALCFFLMKSCIDLPLVFHDPKLLTVTFDVCFFPLGRECLDTNFCCVI